MVVVAGRRCGLRHVGGMVAQGACRGAIRARGGAKGAWEGGRQPVGPHPFDSTRKTCPQRCASPRRARTHRCLLTAAAAGGGGQMVYWRGGAGCGAGVGRLGRAPAAATGFGPRGCGPMDGWTRWGHDG